METQNLTLGVDFNEDGSSGTRKNETHHLGNIQYSTSNERLLNGITQRPSLYLI